jgi:hypothetical protein
MLRHLLVLGFAFTTGVSHGAEGNFSQFPGFAEYYADNPRSEAPPSSEEQRVLLQYRPRLFVGPDEEGPVSFYDDYVANGTLYDADGRIIDDSVDRELLNRHRDEPEIVFVHEPELLPVTPVVFARVDHGEIRGIGRLTYLSYYFVFRHSGLPAGLPGWQATALSVIADLSDWHQLDHYTAASVVLDSSREPFALMLQQHNHQRTYLVGCDISWPTDDRVSLIAAMRSNELYPYRNDHARWRTVSFMTETTLPYLVLGTDKPWASGDDVTDPAREVSYRLDFPPPADAFYSFAGYLGERRALPGRDGPPGADYNTLPALKSREIQLVAFNWREGDRVQMSALGDLLDAAEQGRRVQTLDAWTELQRRFLIRADDCRAVPPAPM